MPIEPILLTGQHVQLEPLSLAHHEGLCQVGLDPELWAWTLDAVSTPEQLRTWVESALAATASGSALAFAVRHLASGNLCGATRFMNYAPEHRRVEIGSTWYGLAYQRTAVNTETKLLLLQHAFGALGCLRVELKTDALNVQSQLAIARLGAVREGTLRHHMVTASGRVRDTVYFSILRQEWPAVETRLRGFLDSKAASAQLRSGAE